MRVDFKNMPDYSRIWIYQSDRDLNESAGTAIGVEIDIEKEQEISKQAEVNLSLIHI